MKKFYSQHFQDLFIYRNFINKNNNGIFVEIGAFDGINHSNTKFFEDSLGFTGMLIEANPKLYNQCLINRPNCICHNFAITDKPGNINFSVPISAEYGDIPISEMGGITDKLIKNPFGENTKYENFTVSGIPFYSILNTTLYSYIDIFFIDVEGGELGILKTIDWNIKIYIICIEFLGNNTEDEEECKKILNDNGFVLEYPLSINHIYINNSNKRPNLYEKKNILFNELVYNSNTNLSENNEGLFTQNDTGWWNMIYNSIQEYEEN